MFLRRPQRKTSRPALIETLERRSLLSGTITGHVHNDINSNGRADEGGIGAPGITFYLDQNRNGRLDKGETSVVSDSSGNFQFTNLHAPGVYYVRNVIPKNFNLTSRAGSVTEKVDLQSSNASATVPTVFVHYVPNPWGQFGQNPQHTSLSPIGVITPATAQNIVALDSTNSAVQVGSALATQFNTLIVPVFENGVYGVLAISRATGATIWSYGSDFVPASGQDGLVIFQPVIGKDRRLYVPGIAGTIHAIGNLDFTSANKPSDTLTPYAIDPLVGRAKYRDNLFISTPLTADSSGHIYYGVTSNGANPQAITNSLIRLTPTLHDKSTVIIAKMNVVPGVAPTLSNDEKSVYLPVNPSGKSSFVRLAAGTLKLISAVQLRDPSTLVAMSLPATLSNTAVVAPDGDVYFGATIPTIGTDSNGDPATVLSQGWLFHFSATLHVKTPFNYGLNNTPTIVPSSIVAAYHGKSSYLLFSKSGFPSSSFNLSGAVSIIDPSVAALSSDTTLNTKVMATVTTLGGQYVYPVVNAIADVASGSIYLTGISQDLNTTDQNGNIVKNGDLHSSLYRWNLSHANLLPTPVILGDASAIIGPSLVGADGELYTVSNSDLFAVSTFATTA